MSCRGGTGTQVLCIPFSSPLFKVFLSSRTFHLALSTSQTLRPHATPGGSGHSLGLRLFRHHSRTHTRKQSASLCVLFFCFCNISAAQISGRRGTLGLVFQQGCPSSRRVLCCPVQNCHKSLSVRRKTPAPFFLLNSEEP